MSDGMTRNCDNCVDSLGQCFDRYDGKSHHKFPEEIKTFTIGYEGKFSLDKLIDDHWKYVEFTLEAHNTPPFQIEIAKHHYVTAAKHFWKHCVEHHGIKE